MSYTEVAMIFQHVDTNQDGRISFPEFRDALLPKTDAVLHRLATSRAPYYVGRD